MNHEIYCINGICCLKIKPIVKKITKKKLPVKVTFSSFEQLPLNAKQKFKVSYHLIDGELSVVVTVESFLV